MSDKVLGINYHKAPNGAACVDHNGATGGLKDGHSPVCVEGDITDIKRGIAGSAVNPTAIVDRGRKEKGEP